MRRFLVSFIFLLLFIPAIEVKAYEGFLLNGKLPNLVHRVNNPERFTDNLYNNTAALLGENSLNPAYVEWQLEKEYNITKIALKWYNGDNTLFFYDANGNVIQTLKCSQITPGRYDATSPPTIYETYIPAVKKIRIENYFTSGMWGNIYEFDVYGTEIQDLQPPSKPSGLSGTIGNGEVTLDWNDNTEGDLAGYNVYKDGVRITTTPIAESQYTVTGLTNGQAYQFKVSAVDTSGNESPLSDPITLTPQEPDTTPPAVPTGLSGIAGNGEVTLTWNAVSDPDLEGYLVFVDGVQITTSPIRSTTYTVTGLQNGRAYEFRVSSVDTSGNFSKQSDPITLTPKKPEIKPPENVETSPGSDENGNYLLITWDEVPDAAGYKIYIDGNFIAQVPAGTTQYKAYGYDSDHRVEVTTVYESGEESEPAKAPDKWDQTRDKMELNVRDLLVMTFQFLMIFWNVILLILASILGPKIYRFLKSIAKEKGVKF